MTIKFSGAINFAEALTKDSNAELSLQGIAYLSRGILDYFATPYWTTGWEVYSPYGELLKAENHYHSIAPFDTFDTAAADSIKFSLPKYPYYNVRYQGELSGEKQIIATARVTVGVAPKPVPLPPTEPPVPDVPTIPPIPIPPTKPPAPEPSPAPSYYQCPYCGAYYQSQAALSAHIKSAHPEEDKKKMDWTPFVIGGAVIVTLMAFSGGRK